ncbi:MAG: YjgN family protein [Alphaproteobacteria bacterium]
MSDVTGQRSQTAARKFEHDGSAATLAPIVIVNTLLTIITLSTYRFWAKTRVRQYLWDQTSLDGDRLEYTGTGKELFYGFLIVFALVLMPLSGASSALGLLLTEDHPLYSASYVALFVLVWFLIGVARYRARRYRLSRTQWRGIRAAQTGSSPLFGAKTLGFFALLPLTLGWTYPWQNMRLMSQMMNNTWFGDRRFTFEGPAGPLYKPFALAWLVQLGMLLGIFLLAWSISGAHAAGGEDGGVGVGIDLGPWAVVLILVPVLYILALPLTFAWYQARQMRYMASCTRYEDVRFSFDATGPSLIWLYFGNLLIMIVTLTFGVPFTQMRRFRYFCDRLTIHGEADFDAIRQSSEKRDRIGEGLADAFDMGAI